MRRDLLCQEQHFFGIDFQRLGQPHDQFRAGVDAKIHFLVLDLADAGVGEADPIGQGALAAPLQKPRWWDSLPNRMALPSGTARADRLGPPRHAITRSGW
jgi:hypothetical protein